MLDWNKVGPIDSFKKTIPVVTTSLPFQHPSSKTYEPFTDRLILMHDIAVTNKYTELVRIVPHKALIKPGDRPRWIEFQDFYSTACYNIT